ncbi:MAG: hypothetical protein WC455_22520 [Dehalococcoidia bacterium]
MKTRKGAYNETDWADVGEWHEATVIFCTLLLTKPTAMWYDTVC